MVSVLKHQLLGYQIDTMLINMRKACETLCLKVTVTHNSDPDEDGGHTMPMPRPLPLNIILYSLRAAPIITSATWQLAKDHWNQCDLYCIFSG